jgi:hypothetical protein
MSNPRQRAHRILRHLPLYSASKDSVNRAPEAIRQQGGIIGVYNLQFADPGACVWITEKGIWTHDTDWEFTPYAQVQRVSYPAVKGEFETDLQLILSDGTQKRARIVGGNGRLRDLYEFGRFLTRSIADVQANSQPAAEIPAGRRGTGKRE